MRFQVGAVLLVVRGEVLFRHGNDIDSHIFKHLCVIEQHLRIVEIRQRKLRLSRAGVEKSVLVRGLRHLPHIHGRFGNIRKSERIRKLGIVEIVVQRHDDVRTVEVLDENLLERHVVDGHDIVLVLHVRAKLRSIIVHGRLFVDDDFDVVLHALRFVINGGKTLERLIRLDRVVDQLHIERRPSSEVSLGSVGSAATGKPDGGSDRQNSCCNQRHDFCLSHHITS